MIWESVALDWMAVLMGIDADLLSSLAHMYYQLPTNLARWVDDELETSQTFAKLAEAIVKAYCQYMFEVNLHSVIPVPNMPVRKLKIVADPETLRVVSQHLGGKFFMYATET